MVEARIDTDKKVLFVVLLIALIGGIFGTYSYFSAKSNTEEQNISTATLSMEFDDSSPFLNAENISPINNEDILTKAAKKSFTVTNTGDIDLTAKIELSDIDMDEELKNSNFKWALYNGDIKLNEGNFEGLSSNTLELVNNISIAQNNPINYTLYIWIQNIDEPQNELQNKKISAIISVSGIQ